MTRMTIKNSYANDAVDLRSDTVTRPTAAMRRAMAEAVVGDDEYGDDPTVNRLEARAAEIFGRNAALFVPSGTMGNLIAILVWTRHGGEVVCEERSHINDYEMASLASVAGCMPRTTFAPDGILTWKMIEPLVRKNLHYQAETQLVELENTHNMAGGTIYPLQVAEEICDRAHALRIPVHLDGARIFNAAVAMKRSVAELTSKFDSVMFCLSKGLGAPVGSVLAGSHDFIERARNFRKALGGQMRQAGVLAAAGLVALEESPKGLARDHENARYLAEGVAKIPGIALDPKKVVTNIVIFDVCRTGKTATQFCEELRKKNVLAGIRDPESVRLVTHYDVDRAGIERAIAAVAEAAAPAAARARR